MSKPIYATTSDAAILLGLSASRVIQLADDGVLPSLARPVVGPDSLA